MRHLGQDIDTYTLHEAEFSCNAIVGFNFGARHLHDQSLIAAIQQRCQFAGEIPRLPNGPIAVQVAWQLEGYERVSYSAAASLALSSVSEVSAHEAVTA